MKSDHYSERQSRYQQFFRQLIQELVARGFTEAIEAGGRNWLTIPSEDRKIFTYAVAFTHGKRVRTEVYFCCEDPEVNTRIFDTLYADHQKIEQLVGGGLTWERLDHRKACRIAKYRPGDIMESAPAELRAIREWAVENLERLRNVFPERIRFALGTK